MGNKIGRITTAGDITEFPIPTADCFPQGITTGPDGNLWFTEYNVNKIGRITTAGVITEFPLPTAGSFPQGITTGPDGNLWFTEYYDKIGRLNLTTPQTGAGWVKTYGGTSYDRVNSVQQTSDGGYIVAGGADSLGAGNDNAWVLKLNADGTVAWQKTYGGTNDDYAASIQQTSDGGYIVAGHTYSFGAGNDDAWVLKLNADGTVAWQKTYGGTSYDYAFSVQQTSDGGYIVAGHTYSFGAGNDDAWY